MTQRSQTIILYRSLVPNPSIVKIEKLTHVHADSLRLEVANALDFATFNAATIPVSNLLRRKRQLLMLSTLCINCHSGPPLEIELGQISWPAAVVTRLCTFRNIMYCLTASIR